MLLCDTALVGGILYTYHGEYPTVGGVYPIRTLSPVLRDSHLFQPIPCSTGALTGPLPRHSPQYINGDHFGRSGVDATGNYQATVPLRWASSGRYPECWDMSDFPIKQAEKRDPRSVSAMYLYWKRSTGFENELTEPRESGESAVQFTSGATWVCSVW